MWSYLTHRYMNVQCCKNTCVSQEPLINTISLIFDVEVEKLMFVNGLKLFSYVSSMTDVCGIKKKGLNALKCNIMTFSRSHLLASVRLFGHNF